jgi:hypothetical protein
MATILSPLSLHGDNRNTKLPILHKSKIHAPKGHFGNSRRSTIGRMTGNPTQHSLDATLVISTRVLRFEVSQHARIPSLPAESSVLALWLNQGT